MNLCYIFKLKKRMLLVILNNEIMAVFNEQFVCEAKVHFELKH